MKKIIYLMLSAFLIITVLFGCSANNEKTTDNTSVQSNKIDPALDLSQMDKQTFKETITPYLDVYSSLIFPTGLYEPLVECSETAYNGYINSEGNILFLSNDETIPDGFEWTGGGSFNLGYIILNYTSMQDLQNDYRNLATKYIDKDFIDIDERIKNADPKLYQQGDKLFYVYGAKGYFTCNSNPDSAMLLESNNGKYTVYAEFDNNGPGDTPKQYYNLFLEVKDGKLLLVDAKEQ